jgi:hypothetical protein
MTSSFIRITVVFLLTLYYSLVKIQGATENDERRRYEAGQPKEIQGILDGDFQMFREGLAGGGSMKEPVEPFLGELILRLGTPYTDFPVCPPLHFAINIGSQSQLTIAEYLIRNLGENYDGYRIPPSSVYDPLNRGYPPAIFFGLGLGGQRANDTHAGFLLRLHKSHPHLLTLETPSKVRDYLRETGNPPILHMTILLNNFEGTYLLTSEFNSSLLYERDAYQLTPLHLSAHLGVNQFTIFLLHNDEKKGELFYSKDSFQRIPFHYSLFQHHLHLFFIFWNYALEQLTPFDNLPNRMEVFKEVLFLQDAFGNDFIDFLLQKPIFHEAMVGLEKVAAQHLKFHGIEALIQANDDRKTKDSKNSQEKHKEMSKRGEIWRNTVKEYSLASQRATSNFYSNLFSSNQPTTPPEIGLSLHPLFSIDSIPASQNFSRLQFQRHYYSLSRPVLIQHQLSRKWSIWAYLPSLIDFLDRYGSLPVEINEQIYVDSYYKHVLCHPPYVLESLFGGKSEYEKECIQPPTYENYVEVEDLFYSLRKQKKVNESDLQRMLNENKQNNRGNVQEKTKVTISDFYFNVRTSATTITGDSSSSEESVKPLMIAQARISFQQYYQENYNQDFQKPSLFSLCASNVSTSSPATTSVYEQSKDYEPFKLTLSSMKAISVFHFHNASYNILLQGKKKWFLFPPSLVFNQTLFMEMENLLGINKTLFFQSSLTQRHLKSLLLLLQSYSMVYEVSQLPQEVLFIPHNWGHIVFSLEDSISLSQEFCTVLSNNLRVQPLGNLLYGGKDAFRGLGYYHSFHKTNIYSRTKLGKLKRKMVTFDDPFFQ